MANERPLLRIALLVSLLAGLPLRAADGSIPPVAQKVLGLFQELRQTPQRPVSFALSDGEINDYMRYALHTTPRPGVESVTVKVFAQNYVSTFTVVDFDALERWKPGTIPMLLRPVLHGKQSIWVDYRFSTSDSKISFTVEKAYYDKLRLPAIFVQEMIKAVAARQPEHYDTSKPVPLPFNLKRVWTEGNVIKGNN
jgi:hypothetical protein